MRRLEGRRVLVTRPADDIGKLSELLGAEGAEVIEAPAIEILPLDHTDELDTALHDLAAGGFEWISFSSPRAVDAVAARVAALGLPRRVPAKVAAVGPATAERLLAAEFVVNVVADPHTTEALAEAIPRGSGRVLLPRADIAPSHLEKLLEARGWEPVRVDAYRTGVPLSLPEAAADALDAGEVDVLVFTSGSTVRGFVRMAGVRPGPRVVCIGPVTEATAREVGFSVDAVASPHTVDGLVAAVIDVLGGADR